MRMMQLFQERQKLLVIVAILMVGVIILAPTLPFFTAVLEERYVAPPNLENPTIPDLPDVISELRISISHLPETVYSEDSVAVTASYTISTHTVSENTDNSFVIAETAIATIIYDDGIFAENHVLMAYNAELNVFEGIIPSQEAGKTISYFVFISVGEVSGYSGENSYYVSYTPTPYIPPPPEIQDLQDLRPPSYMINNVIRDDGVNMTWSEFLNGVVWGTIRISVTFLEGGNFVTTIQLRAINLETYTNQYFSFGRSEDDPYTWILDWDTTKVADGNYGMELRMGIIPENTGGGGGETGVTYAAMASFGFGDGVVSTYIPNEVLIVAAVVLVGIFGIMLYNKRKQMKIKKRRR